MSTPRWAMDQALRELDQAHGGIRRYLLGPGGMSPQTVGAVARRNLNRLRTTWSAQPACPQDIQRRTLTSAS